MASKLINYLNNHDTDGDYPQILYATHTTSYLLSEGIITAKELGVRRCNIFEDDLLYFFYGKPSYDVNYKDELIYSKPEYFPVCFIFDLDHINVYKIHPFDSGGFMSKIYGRYFHRDMKLEEFEIGNEINNILKYVQIIFGDNNSYYRGIALDGLKEEEDFHIKALIQLLTDELGDESDLRANTIEIITNVNVNLIQAIKGIIVPYPLSRKEPFISFITDNNIPYLTYETYSKLPPSKYTYPVLEKVKEFYRTCGLI